jgi:hypothetical protein
MIKNKLNYALISSYQISNIIKIDIIDVHAYLFKIYDISYIYIVKYQEIVAISIIDVHAYLFKIYDISNIYIVKYQEIVAISII